MANTKVPAWLYQESDRDILSDQADEVFDLLRTEKRFSYLKINHGLWERLLATEQAELKPDGTSLWDHGDYFIEGGFRKELIELLHNGVSKRNGLILAVSVFAFPNSSRLTGWPADSKALRELIVRVLPTTAELRDGLMWKWVVLEGRLPELVDLLRQRPVLVVGPSHLNALASYFSAENISNLVIPLRTARKQRKQILEQVLEWSDKQASDRPVVLLQAGSLSVWLVGELDKRRCPATLIDLGRVMDLAAPQKAESQDWIRFHCSQINQATDALKQPRPLRDWDPDLVELCRIPDTLFEATPDGGSTGGIIGFLENKPTYAALVDHLLLASATDNHWANQGPVATLLEETIATTMALAPTIKVVVCSSATSALEALVALEEERAGKQIRWILPAYTFASSLIASRGKCQVVDVAANGQFSLSALRQVDPTTYDGIIMTNVFGRDSTRHDLQQFCRTRGKALVLDNATGLDAGSDRTKLSPGEAISFHHTKVWGMGEGGCILCQAKDEERLRALISPGLVGPVAPERRRNAKLDDYAAARILARLVYRPRWRRAYRWQAWRIEEAATSAGFQPFGTPFTPQGSMATLGFAPLLASFSVDRAALAAGTTLVAQKYYRPLAGRPIASDLFDRVVCVPTHPGLARLSREDLRRYFLGLRPKRPIP